jgi:hypothetical protein
MSLSIDSRRPVCHFICASAAATASASPCRTAGGSPTNRATTAAYGSIGSENGILPMTGRATGADSHRVIGAAGNRNTRFVDITAGSTASASISPTRAATSHHQQVNMPTVGYRERSAAFEDVRGPVRALRVGIVRHGSARRGNGGIVRHGSARRGNGGGRVLRQRQSE